MATTWKDRWLYRPHPIIVITFFVTSVFMLWYTQNSSGPVADNETHGILVEGKVLKVIDQKNEPASFAAGTVPVQDLLVHIDDPNQGPRDITVKNDLTPVAAGQDIYVNAMSLDTDAENFNILDVKRSTGLAWLFAGFMTLVLLVSGKKGINALVGMFFSVAVIFSYIVPAILHGGDPVTIGLLAAAAILAGTFYVSYGFDGKSVSALAGIATALVLVGFAGQLVVHGLHFTGYADENAIYLAQQTNNMVNLIGLAIAGIIIAAIGVLDDVAITQSSTVYELAKASPARGWQLFRHAMQVGTDHIAGVINTLVLAYAGASLPLILLLKLSNFPLSFTLGGELIAQEIVRTIVSSAGLVLAVPLTTAVAVLMVERWGAHGPSHAHHH